MRRLDGIIDSMDMSLSKLQEMVKDRNCFTVAVVQSLSPVSLFATPWTAAHQASLSFTISQSLLKLLSIESMMPSNCLILCRPLLLLPSVFPSIRVFSSELALLITWVKYWSISFNISLSNEYSGLISFNIDHSVLIFQTYPSLVSPLGTLRV